MRHLKTDKEKWEWVIHNKNVVVCLDNDETFILDSKTNEYISFDNYIGNSFGLCTLLDVIDINFKMV